MRPRDARHLLLSVTTLRNTVREKALFGFRLIAVMLTVLGFMGVLLAAVGLYGIMAYGVSRRTREIGIRMALGAQRNDVLKLVVRQGLLLTLIGLAIGLAISLAATRILSAFLLRVSPRDPTTFLLAPAILAAVALLASYIPARRATKVDPVIALRFE